MGNSTSATPTPSPVGADRGDVAAERRRHELELEAERRRSEQMLWTLLQEKEALQSEKEQLLQASAAVLGATALVGAGVLALFRRRHTIAMDALRLAATESQSRSLANLERAQRFGAEPLAKSLVPVCDNIDALCASLRAADGIAPSLLDGADLTASSLSRALSKHSVSKLSPPVGARFDPHLHEAVFTAPLAAGRTVGAIQSVLRPGYVLHETRLLRPAQVGVFSSEPQTAMSAEASTPDVPSCEPGPPNASPDSPPRDRLAPSGPEPPPAATDSTPPSQRSEVATQSSPPSGSGAEAQRGKSREALGQLPPDAGGPWSPAPVAAPVAPAKAAQDDPVGSAAGPAVRRPDAEQERGIAIEKMLMLSMGSGLSPRPPAAGLPAPPDAIGSPVRPLPGRAGTAAMADGTDEAVGLTEDELHELLVLHARQPERWHAPALAARFGVDERSVGAALQYCAAYRVVPEEDEGSAMGVAQPIMPDEGARPRPSGTPLAGSLHGAEAA
eukprot:scaffold501_cov105-Isochrysis_galbana.AAC.13